MLAVVLKSSHLPGGSEVIQEPFRVALSTTVNSHDERWLVQEWGPSENRKGTRKSLKILTSLNCFFCAGPAQFQNCSGKEICFFSKGLATSSCTRLY